MLTLISFVCLLSASLTESVYLNDDKQDGKAKYIWNKVDQDNEIHPKNIILFLGLPVKNQDCKNDFLNYTEPEYVRFSSVTSVKSCLSANSTQLNSLPLLIRLALHSSQHGCDYCKKSLQQAISDLVDINTNVRHVPSGLITLTNFSVYEINGGSKSNIQNFRGHHLLYQRGFDETKFKNDEEEQSESDGLVYALMKEIHSIQTKFCKNLLKAFGFSEPPFASYEDQYFFSEGTKLVDMVHDMLKKLQHSHKNNGFVLVVHGGELQEHCGTEGSQELNNAVMAVITETDPATTLVVVTASCPEDNSNNSFDATTKVYAQGPGSKQLADVKFLWNVPRVLMKILQTDFKTTRIDESISKVNISSLQNHTSKQINSWDYETTGKNKHFDDHFVTPEQEGIFDQYTKQINYNITEKQADGQRESFHEKTINANSLDEDPEKIEASPNTIKENDDNKQNIQKTTVAHDKPDETKDHVVSYIENAKQEHKLKPSATHLPEQQVSINIHSSMFNIIDNNENDLQNHSTEINNEQKNIPHITPLEQQDSINKHSAIFNITDNTENDLQKHSAVINNVQQNIPLITPLLKEEKANTDAILPNIKDITTHNNLPLLSTIFITQNQFSEPSEEEIHANELIKNNHHNEENENVLTVHRKIF